MSSPTSKDRGRTGFTPRVGFAAAVLGLLVVAALLRAWNLSAAGMWHDEALAHYYALQDPGWIVRASAGTINHPPLFFLLLHLWLEWVPPYVQAAVESINLVISLVGLGIFAAWARRIFSPTRTLILTALLVLHPFHVHYSTELRMYAPALTGVVVTGYFTTLLVRGDMTDVPCWIGWVLGALVSLYTHSFTGLYVGVMALYLLAVARRRGRLREALTALACLLGLYGPWFVFVARQAARISGDYWIGAFQFRQLLMLVYHYAGYVGPKSPGGVTLIKSLLACVGFLAPLLWSLRREASLARLFWLVLAAPIAAVTVVSLVGQSVFLYRPFLFGLPFALLLVGMGVDVLPAGRVFIALLAVLVVWETWELKTHPPFRHLRTMARTLEQTARGRVTVHVDTHSYFPSLFYRRHEGRDYLLGRDKVSGREFGRDAFWRLSRSRSVLLVLPRGERRSFRKKVARRRGTRLVRPAERRGGYDVLEVFPEEPRESPSSSSARSDR